MSQRKRKQGQQRRLHKYLRSQTGTTEPQALLMREQALVEKMEAMDLQIQELTNILTERPVEVDASDSGESAASLLSQQRTHLDYLHTMRNDLQETLRVNRRIHHALCRAH